VWQHDKKLKLSDWVAWLANEDLRLTQGNSVKCIDLACWQGLDFAVLYQLRNRYATKTGLIITRPDFMTDEAKTNQFFYDVKYAVTHELESTNRFVTPETQRVLLLILQGLVRIIHYVLDCKRGTTYVITDEARGLDPDNFFEFKQPLYADHKLLKEYVKTGATPMTLIHKQTEAEKALNNRINKQWRRSIQRNLLLDYNDLACAPDPTGVRRRAAFRVFLDRHSEPPSTAVVLNLTHGGFIHDEDNGFRAWKIPPGKSLIMVTNATPGMINCTYGGFYDTAKTLIQRTIAKCRTPLDPLELVETPGFMDALNAEKYKVSDSIRSEHTVNDKLDVDFATKCFPVRVTYFKDGDTCLEKEYSRNKDKDDSRSGIELLHSNGGLIYESMLPPLLFNVRRLKVSLSETVQNLYRRGYNHVVFFDKSCSSVLQGSSSSGRFVNHGMVTNRDAKRVGTDLKRTGLAGGGGRFSTS
jgi:hypothetical protein